MICHVDDTENLCQCLSAELKQNRCQENNLKNVKMNKSPSDKIAKSSSRELLIK